MKKRLLSAALALAMVLTLLPMSAFAAAADAPTASDPKKATVQYVSGEDFSKPKEGGGFVKNAWTWSYKSDTDSKTYWADGSSLSGIVTGTNASGTYYAAADIANATGFLVSNSFTIVGGGTITVNSAHLNGVSNSLSVNTFGGTLAFGPSALEKVNSLTVTDTAATVGTVSALTRDVGSYNAGADNTSKSTGGLTLSITDAGVTGGISLTGRSNRVTLTNVALTGNIELDGKTTVTNANGTNTVTSAAQTLTTNPKAAWPYTKSSVTGKVEITGNGSNVALNGTAVTGMVNVTSTGGSFRVDNGTTTGAVTIASGDEKATDAPPTVTINDGSVGGITYELGTISTAAANITVNAQGGATGAIAVDSGTVTIHSANVDDITLKQGTLNMDGANGTAGDITLAASGKTTFNFSGTGWTVDKLATGNGNLLTIGSNWPTGRSNTFTELALTGYTGQGIKGGIVGGTNVIEQRGWFAADLQFGRTADTLIALYGTRELADAIADAGEDAADEGNINVIGATATNYVEFYNSMVDANSTTSNPIASVGYGKSTGIYLPDKINGTAVATWTNLADAKEYSVNEEVPISIEAAPGGIKLVIQSAGAAVSKLTNVTTLPSGTANANVTATLNNNQIVLSGAVGQDSYEDIKLTLTTDLIANTGNAVTFNVLVSYNTTTKTGKFSTLGMTNPPLGVTVNSNNIVVGSNTYTLTTSGLAKPAANLKVAGVTGDYGYTSATVTGKGIVPTVNVSGMGTVTKADLIAKLSAGEFDWTTSPAMRQVVNQAMATITANNTLDNYVTAAQRAAWTGLGNKGKTPTEADLAGTGYTTAVLEPYLALTVTGYNASGTMTATLVPSYRVIVVSTVAANETALAGKSGFTTEGYYIAQQGRALNTPINDLTGADADDVGVTLRLCGSDAADKLPTGFSTSTVLHQDSIYAYKTNGTDANKFVLTHGGKTGLGTIVLNSTEPLVRMLPAGGTAATDTVYYDNLQAAIDDTKLSTTAGKFDKITVTAAYTGSGVIDVTGEARTFKIETLGQTTITPANKNFTVGVDTTGHTYTVQLTKSIAPAGQNIVVSSATGGSASVSANPAQVGSKVTVTLSAQAGYSPSGVSVKDSSGKAVSVSGSGSSYSFTMPSGSVTVTPSFTKTQVATNPTVHVSGTTGGSAYTSAGNNQVAPGTTVTVTTTPGANQRTMGVSVTGATAVRTGANTFQFTVPSGYNTVTVTPRFDANNGTLFQDVWSYEYYSNPVRWAVERGITNGTSTYTFGSENVCTREDMVTFLWRAAGSPAVSSSVRNPFWDVQAGSYYYNAVLWAVSKGITNGVSANQFGVGQYVTRGQAVTFLYRYEGSPAAGTNSGFYDVNSREYYAKAVSWANAKGVTNGTSATTFGPNEYCKRAQIVTFLYRDITGNRA